MAKWFEIKVKTEKMGDDGSSKPVQQTFLVDALSFTEAESRISEEMSHFSSNFQVTAIKSTKIAEIFFDDYSDTSDKYFLVKVAFITLDEKTAVEKRKYSLILVQAADFKDSFEKFTKGMQGSMADYEIASITETPIMDVYKIQTAAPAPAPAS